MASSAQDVPQESVVDHHVALLAHCLSLARNAPALPTNFRVGAILVDRRNGNLLAEGYTNELPGNTHAEQVCLMKLHHVGTEARGPDPGSKDDGAMLLKQGYVDLYTTVEPCVKRLSGEKSCVERILETKRHGKGIQTIHVGVGEPNTFVASNRGRGMLQEAGIGVIHIPGLEDQILEVAKAGHTTSAN